VAANPPFNVAMLICDAAAVADGKLYVLGGGWSRVTADTPFNLAIAAKIAVPWSETNRNLDVHVQLRTMDGEPVGFDEQVIEHRGLLQVGRPVGLTAGTDIDAPMAFAFNGLQLQEGQYVMIMEIDGEPVARAPFQAVVR
jgi:hypothetical protein